MTQQLYITVNGVDWILCPLCRTKRLFQTAFGISRHVTKFHQQWWLIGWLDVP